MQMGCWTQLQNAHGNTVEARERGSSNFRRTAKPTLDPGRWSRASKPRRSLLRKGGPPSRTSAQCKFLALTAVADGFAELVACDLVERAPSCRAPRSTR
jgi:hypothetical protein